MILSPSGLPWMMNWRTLSEIAEWSDRWSPREACGLLVRVPYGEFNWVLFRPCRNAALRSNEYEVHPDDHLEAIADGLDIIGVVHSHVFVGADLSGTDKAMAAPGFMYAVYSIKNRELKGWMLVDGEWGQVEIEVQSPW